MRAATLVAEGDPSTAIVVRDEPIPELAAGEVLVRLRYAALNHLDIWVRKGMPSVPKPRVLGGDGAGVVEAISEDALELMNQRGIGIGDGVLLNPGLSCGECSDCLSGDSVLCRKFSVLGEHRAGTHAQYIAISAENIHLVPKHLDMKAAAALPLTFATAWRMLFTRAKAQSGESAIIWGASSGVGVAALQLSKAAGINTLATSRSVSKSERLIELGAAYVTVTGSLTDAKELSELITYDAKQIVNDRGFDIAFDHLGKVAWGASVRALRPGGRYVTCGVTTGANPPAEIGRIFWKQLSMLGSTMASQSDFQAMLDFVSEHEITPVVDKEFSLEQIAEAHEYLEASNQVGKVVIDVG